MAYKRKTAGNDEEWIGQEKCQECRSTNQARRHVHFLKFPTSSSLAGHLKEVFEDRELKNDRGDNGFISGICVWYQAINHLYGDMKMVRTDGVKMPLWEVWLSQQTEAPAMVNSDDPRCEDEEYAKEGFRLLKLGNKTHKTKLEKESLIAGMRMMETTWPGKGWSKNASELEKEYSK